MTFRAATPAEQPYTTDQSMQIEGQTGCIGHLRADIGADGNDFFRTWKDHRQNLDGEEFQREFEWVLNALVDEKQCGDFLKSRSAIPVLSALDGYAGYIGIGKHGGAAHD